MEYEILRQICKVQFELSTLCNYAAFHKKCPLHNNAEHTILPARAIYNVINEFAAIEYSGMFLFNVYNEPLIDPRLFIFTNLAKKSCPKSTTFIITNGYYLDQNLADELPQYGIDMMAVSLYTAQEKERLTKLRYPIDVQFWGRTMDERLEFYSHNSRPTSCNPCVRGAPLEEITITAQGNVVLCCLDWKQEAVFGNILHESVASIVSKPEFTAAYDELKRGVRTRPICQVCEQSPAGRSSVRVK